MCVCHCGKKGAMDGSLMISLPTENIALIEAIKLQIMASNQDMSLVKD